MIDIHCHLLPGVDDGADTMDEALDMARLAFASGTRAMVMTPHANVPGGFRNLWNEGLEQRMLMLREAIQTAAIPLDVLFGMEVFATDDTADRIREGSVLTLGGSRYVLLEFLIHDRAARAELVLRSVEALGLVPVIAHPERYVFLQDDLSLAQRWADRGYLLQLNKGSILGAFGRRVHQVACALLGERLAHVVASDGHSPYQRVPTLAETYTFVAQRWSRAYAESLLRETPHKIITNQA